MEYLRDKFSKLTGIGYDNKISRAFGSKIAGILKDDSFVVSESKKVTLNQIPEFLLKKVVKDLKLQYYEPLEQYIPYDESQITDLKVTTFSSGEDAVTFLYYGHPMIYQIKNGKIIGTLRSGPFQKSYLQTSGIQRTETYDGHNQGLGRKRLIIFSKLKKGSYSGNIFESDHAKKMWQELEQLGEAEYLNQLGRYKLK